MFSFRHRFETKGQECVCFLSRRCLYNVYITFITIQTVLISSA